jgi:hypothetical protein
LIGTNGEKKQRAKAGNAAIGVKMRVIGPDHFDEVLKVYDV